MNIVLLNTFPVWGGDEKWTINLGKGLKDRGHVVVISSEPGSATEQKAMEAGLRIFPFHIGPDIAFWKIRPFQKFLKDNEINVVLCVQNRDVKIGGLAARLAGVPAIFSRQGLDIIKRKLDHKFVFTRFIDGIITNTNSIKELYDGYGWFPKDFVKVVYDGVSVPEKVEEIDLHTKFDLIPNSKVIIGTGRLVEQKRFDLLIETARIAKDQKQPWSFLVAGEGELRPKLESKAADLGVGNMVKFIGFHEDAFSLMNSSDLFVLTSDSEGMSNALREAMAIGLPCIATDVFGVEELFESERCGIKIPKGNPQAIFEATKRILSEPTLRKEITENAKEHIQNSFSMDQMIDKIESLFENQLR